jgi:hypothetical protein
MSTRSAPRPQDLEDQGRIEGARHLPHGRMSAVTGTRWSGPVFFGVGA